MPTNLDVDLLKTFIAISQSGSFTRAAEQVYKTQSAVSMQMKRLEEMLGRPVFRKQGRTNTLTPDGERLLDYAHRIAKLNDEAVATFKQPELTGLIRFGTPEDYADKLLPEMLARFARSHPMVQVDVECTGSTTLKTEIENKSLDLAIVTSCDNVRPECIIRREELVWVTSKNHKAHEQDTVPLALSHISCSWRQMAIQAMENSGKKHRVAYVSANSNTVASMVLSGMAIAAIPRFVMHKGMRVLTSSEGFEPLGEFDIGLLRAEAPANNAIDALARHITDSFSNLTETLVAAE
jgi:DNA-binding transcriptional LysR family regulator